MKNKTAYLIALSIMTMLNSCVNKGSLKGLYILNSQTLSDTLILEESVYHRKYRCQDSIVINTGEWFLEDNQHISFSNWSDYNKILPGPNEGTHKGMVWLLLGTRFFFYNGDIIFNSNEDEKYVKTQ